MLLIMLSVSDTHRAYPVIVQTNASEMRLGSMQRRKDAGKSDARKRMDLCRDR